MARETRISRLIQRLHAQPNASLDELAAVLGTHPFIIAQDLMQIRSL